MLKAGVKFLFFGLETTSSESLSSIQKSHTSLTLVTNALGWFKTRGVTMGASLIIGLPNQTIDDITTDITRLLELNIEFGSPNPFYPIPGSKMYDECIHDGLISPNEDLTWFCEFNFPIQTPNFTRADIYDLWSICNAINYWPQIITAYRDNVPIGERLRYLSQQSAFRGKIEVYPKGIIFIPDAGISYSEINCLSADNDNGALFVDEVTSDMVANMIYFLTRTPHKAVQTKSILNKDPYNEFYIYPYENKRSRAIDNLVSKITRLYNQQQEGHDVR